MDVGQSARNPNTSPVRVNSCFALFFSPYLKMSIYLPGRDVLFSLVLWIVLKIKGLRFLFRTDKTASKRHLASSVRVTLSSLQDKIKCISFCCDIARIYLGLRLVFFLIIFTACSASSLMRVMLRPCVTHHFWMLTTSVEQPKCISSRLKTPHSRLNTTYQTGFATLLALHSSWFLLQERGRRRCPACMLGPVFLPAHDRTISVAFVRQVHLTMGG